MFSIRKISDVLILIFLRLPFFVMGVGRVNGRDGMTVGTKVVSEHKCASLGTMACQRA